MGASVDYQAAFEALPCPCMVLTRGRVVLAVNDAYLRMTGQDRAEVIGRALLGEAPVLADLSASGAAKVRASLARVAGAGVGDVVPLLRDDWDPPDQRHWRLTQAPVLDPAGDVKEIVVVFGEVSGPLESRRAAPGPTGGRVSGPLKPNALLHQAYRQEQQKVSMLHETIEHQQRFVFDAAHDLRNPIAGLLTELEEALSDPGADLRRTLHSLHRDAERLNDIVGDLLALARLYTAPPPGADLVDLARLVVEELDAHPPSASVLTRLEENVVVRASRVRLARLLSNLAANAERHTTSRIEFVVAAAPPYAVLEVLDDGPGIPPEERERIFHRLYREEQARSLDAGGSGFGLPIAREIAHAYGGDLFVADHQGGARFVLRLPLAT
ncbi:sensor histidine kinase [Nonomuraea sp. NPDC051191]|uniref:sensor histidine kinase n=1 Tax=Nonomuraea sp. NPDC051191 TaxID=3364372 RepID=UPI00379611A1